METIDKQQKAEELMKTLIDKAWKSPEFKEQFIKNPVGTIREVTGTDIQLPENQRIVVVDQTDESIMYFNIPRDPSSMELSSEQLETVAGGGSGPGDLSYDAGYVIGGWIKDAVDWVKSKF